MRAGETILALARRQAPLNVDLAGLKPVLVGEEVLRLLLSLLRQRSAY